MKLLSGPLSMFGAKAEIALREKGLAFDIQMVPFDAEDRYAPTHPDVARINPVRRQVPVLIDDGVELFDSTQIFEYLDDRYLAERKGAWMSHATPRLLAWRDRVGRRAAVQAVVGPMMLFLHSQGRPVPPFLQWHLPASGER